MNLGETVAVVLKLSNKKFEIVDLPVREVNYCSIEGGVITYTSRGGQVYYQITTVEELERYMERHNFKRVERGYLANMENVVGFNEERYKLYFETPFNPKEQLVPVGQRYLTALRQEGFVTHSNHACAILSTQL